METKRKLYIAAAVLMVLVVALGLLTACTSESLVEYEAPAVSTALTTYTLTVQASKGEAVTRALLLNNEGTPQESLDAVWMTTETIDVYKGETKVGELTPQEDNVAQTILQGEVSNVAVNDELTLKFLSPSYANQSGTLDYIAAHCDYATASVTVLGINGTDVTTTVADFENQQSIVKFTLQDKNNSNAAISATEMIVVADGHTYTVQPSAATNEFFVALPSFSEKAISVITTNGTDNYIFDRESTTIESGKYYTLTMQMDKLVGNLVDLSTLEGNYTAQRGDILTGTIDHTKKITIAAGASITLYNVSINASGVHSSNTDWAGITCQVNATITLVGTNVVNGCGNGYPGIQAGGEGTTLTINGTGSLTAKGGDFAAGIGSGYEGICGNISISGGTINATGVYDGAGIGSGEYGSCGNISISGGTITATGGYNAAGIGSGHKGSCGNITISGTASGTATGGFGSSYDIGPGKDGSCGTVSLQANIISGSCYGIVNLSTLEGNYTAKDGDILTGTIDNTKKIIIAAGASITLNNVSINAGGTLGDATKWAGLTCEGNATITLVGTNVVNSCGNGYPGIQAGGEGTTLTINGTGSLNATGGYGGAGIGSGDHGSCGNISISGGTINATGGDFAAGIGSGSYGSCGNISISGTASGSATGGNDSSYDIGPGEGGTCGIVSVQDNTISGSYPVATCTFTVNFKQGDSTALVLTKEITITCGQWEYTVKDEHGNSVAPGTLTVDLPLGTNLSFTFTASCIRMADGSPAGTFSTTLTGVTITAGENNLGTVTLVKQ